MKRNRSKVALKAPLRIGCRVVSGDKKNVSPVLARPFREVSFALSPMLSMILGAFVFSTWSVRCVCLAMCFRCSWRAARVVTIWYGTASLTLHSWTFVWRRSRNTPPMPAPCKCALSITLSCSLMIAHTCAKFSASEKYLDDNVQQYNFHNSSECFRSKKAVDL